MKQPLQLILTFIFSTLFIGGRAESFSVIPTSTTEARVVEENAPATMQVAYQQSGGNGKGWLTQGAQAELVITGIPTGYISEVKVFMHSNTKSGSGTVSLTLDEQTLLAFSGSFADWQKTGYSTTFIPFSAQGQWRVNQQTELHLSIAATANSLYLQQIMVTYTPDPPVPQCATLHWTDGTEGLTQQLCEQEAASGILLPELEDTERTIQMGEATYRFVGWTDHPVDDTETMPFVVAAGRRYYITTPDAQLYALYRLQTEQALVTTNDVVTGEYAMALRATTDMLAVAAGRVSNRLLTAAYQPLQRNEDGLVVWSASSVPDEMRYRIEVNGDSLTIYHPATNTYIAYNNSGSLSPNRRPWAWQKLGNGTICIFHNSRSATEGRSVVVKEGENATIYWGEGQCMWKEADEKLFLFNLDGVSDLVVPTRYTTFPTLTPVPETETAESSNTYHKEWHNGQIVIRCGNTIYSILGTLKKNQP